MFINFVRSGPACFNTVRKTFRAGLSLGCSPATARCLASGLSVFSEDERGRFRDWGEQSNRSRDTNEGKTVGVEPKTEA